MLVALAVACSGTRRRRASPSTSAQRRRDAESRHAGRHGFRRRWPRRKAPSRLPEIHASDRKAASSSTAARAARAPPTSPRLSPSRRPTSRSTGRPMAATARPRGDLAVTTGLYTVKHGRPADREGRYVTVWKQECGGRTEGLSMDLSCPIPPAAAVPPTPDPKDAPARPGLNDDFSFRLRPFAYGTAKPQGE